jgi:osmotically-inducible protein OsmY
VNTVSLPPAIDKFVGADTSDSMRMSDHQLKQAVERELAWSCDVDNDRVGVAVTDGSVTLFGEVLSHPEKIAATNAALRVRGVTALADDIVVRHALGQIADADIARDAKTALLNTTLVPLDSVQVVVSEHRVTLSGVVSWHHQRTAAASAVSVLPGVIDVTNLIVLKPHDRMIAASDVRANVIAAMLRNSQLEAEHVEVTVSGTEIRLAGHVASWAARHQAEYAAWCSPGVTHVDNQLAISA